MKLIDKQLIINIYTELFESISCTPIEIRIEIEKDFSNQIFFTDEQLKEIISTVQFKIEQKRRINK